MGSDLSKQNSIIENLKTSQINFMVNGVEYSPNLNEIDPNSRLVDFIRDHAGLKGTKYMCREGGCGACVVMLKKKSPDTGAEVIRGINSCVFPVLSCDGCEIFTVEHLGNYKTGYHEIQKRLINTGGSQCGYCTTGMVMNMYSLMESENWKLPQKDIEDAFDGNLCRCTGYRPILDAFKSFGTDASEELKRKCYISSSTDEIKCCKSNSNGKTNQTGKSGNCCKSSEIKKSDDFCKVKANELFPIRLSLKSGEEWIRPTDLNQFFEAVSQFKSSDINYRLVAGNTGTGVFKNDGPYMAFVDISCLPELLNSTKLEPSNVIIGAGHSLREVIEILRKASEIEGYEYAGQLSTHCKRIANTPVRNIGTIAGNLMLKHGHNSFPSDIYTLMEGVGAKLKIASGPNLIEDYLPKEFLQLSMIGKIIISIELPNLPKKDGFFFQSYKITKRYQNSHAYVNAAFLMKLDEHFTVLESPRIVFGGILPDFDHVFEAEKYLTGKSLKEQSTLDGVLNELENEVYPDKNHVDASPEYRKKLTQSLMYKTILKILGNHASPHVQSGGEMIERLLTTGQQTFDTDKAEWPVNQPVNKIEGAFQASGEAEYVNDIPRQTNELIGALLVSEVSNAEIDFIDPSEALMVPGVFKFIDHKDVPGENDTEGDWAGVPMDVEEIFSSGKIEHAGQCLGLLLAETRDIAYKALKLIKVSYKNHAQPTITFPDSMKKLVEAERHQKLKDGKQKIVGVFKIGDQYHLTMETHVTLCVPKEGGRMDVFPASQWMDLSQSRVASALGIPCNRVNVSVRRCGGGYGAKIIKAAKVTTAAAVGAYVTNRPVRIVLDLESNMKMMGKRPEYLVKYETEFDESGFMSSNKIDLICNSGVNSNQSTSPYSMAYIQTCYKAAHWTVTPTSFKSNLAPNTYCRAPGSTEAIALAENIIEHIAKILGKDPNDVRAANYLQSGDPLRGISLELFKKMPKHPGMNLKNVEAEKDPTPSHFDGENPIPKMLEELKVSADYENRAKFVEEFNTKNRWRKRGLSFIPVRYPMHYPFPFHQTFISIYAQDGTVTIIQNGIEIGQGLNTKVAQVAAKTLGIPMDKILINPSDSVTCPNSALTGGSWSSELSCYSTMKACDIILQRLEPIKSKMGPEATWEDIVMMANKANIDLCATYRNLSNADEGFKEYDIFIVGLAEVEIDILTGENKVIRHDIIADNGISLSPMVDIGQAEGCIVMGIGLWTTEKLIYHPETGDLLTNNTWDYKPPLPKDMPEDLRITLLKNAPNKLGILRSKASGEPPLNTSVACLFAMRNALYSARKDATGKDEYFQIDGPSTPEDIFLYSLIDKSQFIL